MEPAVAAALLVIGACETAEEKWLRLGQCPDLSERLSEVKADLESRLQPRDDSRAALEQFHKDLERVEEQGRRAKERNAEWRRLPMAQRMHVVLNALGDDRLTVAELTDRLYEEHRVSESGIRSLVYKLHQQDQVDRVGEPRVPGTHGGAAIQYRYFRRATPTPKLEALERALEDE